MYYINLYFCSYVFNRLEELHICMNRYHKVEAKAGKKYTTVKRIHFNNNPATEWKNVRINTINYERNNPE